MKNSRLSIILSCIIGVAIGSIAITGIFSNKIFSNSLTLPRENTSSTLMLTVPLNPMTKIPYDTMQKRIAGYLAPNHLINSAPFESFLIDRTQLEIISTLMQGNAGISGIRIFLGYNGNNPTTMVLRYNADGTRDLNNIYETARGTSGPCPIICDKK
jgi:hypothetical protein